MPHEILHALEHSLIETAKMAPIIFLAYLFMEWLEHTSSARLGNAVHKVKGAGPFIGSALGLIPQCGFSGANYLCRVFKKETGQTPAQWRAAAARTAMADLTAEEKTREQEMFI